MNVLQIVTTDDRSFFVDQVGALERRGINCDVFPASPGQRRYRDALGPVSSRLLPEPGHNVPYYALNALYAQPRILKAVLNGDYDLVHANSGLTAPLALLQPCRPVVQTFWGSDLMGDYLNGAYRHIAKRCAQHFDAVIVRNEEMRREIGDAYVIPAGIDLQKFRPIPRNEARQHVGWTENKRYVLFPYVPDFPYESKQRRKNYPLAKRVVEQANRELAETVELEAVYGEPHDQIPYYMNAADALLLTSRLEGSPNTVKEALACNVPVVSTDVGDVRERLRNVHPSAVGTSETELVDGLVEVLKQDEPCNGREQVQDLSWERMGERIEQVYESVIDDGQR